MLAALVLAVPARAAGVGALVAIGGGAEDPALIQDILELARGKASRVAILNTASSDPARSGPVYTRFFQALGVTSVSVIPLLTRQQAYDPAVLDQIGQADLVYVTGGNQIRLAQTLADTPAHGAILAAWQRGAVLAGTSAGAMVWGPLYLSAGSSESSLAKGATVLGAADRTTAGKAGVELRPGLGMVPDVLVDTHFAREGRLGRLLVAAAQQRQATGIGVDEDTAAVITAEGVRALGNGRVTVLDLKRASFGGRVRGPFGVRNVDMHLLAGGDSLRWRRDAADRTPMLAARGREAVLAPSLWLQGSDSQPPTGWFRGAGGSRVGDTGVFGRQPEEVLILAGTGATDQANKWQGMLQSNGRTTVRILNATQVVGPQFTRYLPIAGAVLLVDDAQWTLARSLSGEPGRALRQQANRLQVAAVGGAVSMLGETAVKPGTNSGELVPALRVAPAWIASPNLWASGAFDRLVVDALMAGGALGIGLAPNNAVRMDGGTLRVVGDAPVVVLETDKVSLANPAVPSARDLRLHVLAPGEEFRP